MLVLISISVKRASGLRKGRTLNRSPPVAAVIGTNYVAGARPSHDIGPESGRYEFSYIMLFHPGGLIET